MLPITAQKFDAVVSDLKLSDEVRHALRAHLVDGMTIVDALAKFGVSQSGFYAAAGRLQAHLPEAKTKRLVLLVPEHRADQLRALVARQLAIWAESDESQQG